MKQVSKVALVTLGFGVLIAVLGASTSGPVGAQDPGPPGGLDVRVVNTPLPVTGSISISGTPTVNAQQSGTWNVGINGTPTVTLPTHLGAQPSNLVTLQCVSFSGGQCTDLRRRAPDGTLEGSSFTIPVGMTLVITDIQWVATFTDLPAGGLAFLEITVSLPAGTSRVYLSSAVTLPLAASATQTGANDHLTGGLHFSVVPGISFPPQSAFKQVTVLGYLAPQ